tara:strand:+ start:1697 stop:2374 length:678 start_codon:yes stop_codon:yes gene_type:complete
MVKVLFVCFSMGTGGETLATEISKAPTCETLQASRYDNKRTMTKDIFNGMFRGPGASTKKYRITTQDIDNCLSKVKSNKWQVVPSHFGYDAFEHLDFEMKFVVIKNPVQQEHKNNVYNHIKNKILDHRYTNIQELYGSIKHAFPDLDAKEVLKGHNHQPTGAELMVKHDKQYNNIDAIYNNFPKDAMLKQFEGETFPKAIYVEYADTQEPNFYSNFTKKIHQLTK